MVAEMPSPPVEPRADVRVELEDLPAELAHEPMRESWSGFEPMRTRALLGGEEVGSIGWVIQTHLDRLGVPCVNIWSLGVKEAHRRKGIGSSLVSNVMLRSHGAGARFASVGTQLWNAPAHATYVRLGFRPYCVVVGRALIVSPENGESGS